MFLGLPIAFYIIAAAWRMSNLLANEDGPFHFIKTLRGKIARAEVKSRRRNGLLSRFHLYEGVNCEYCNSIWFGIVFTISYFVFGTAFLWVILPLAISTGAIIIKHIVFLTKSVDTYFDKLNHSALVDYGQRKWDGLFSQTLTGKEELIRE